MKAIYKSLGILPVILLFFGCNGSRHETVYTGVIEGETYSVSVPFAEELQVLNVREGDWVKKGDVLGRMNTDGLELQLNGLESKADQLRFQYEELDIRQEQAASVAEYHADTYRRFRDLQDQNAVSDQTVRDLKLQADTAMYEAEILAAKKQILSSQIRELEFGIEDLNRTILRGTLVSPANGYVDKIFYEPGEYLGALRPVVEITDLEDVWCTVYVGEETLMQILPGDHIEAILQDRIFPGTIGRISSEAEFTPKEVLTEDNREALSYGVTVHLENPDKVLKIGMPINVVLIHE